MPAKSFSKHLLQIVVYVLFMSFFLLGCSRDETPPMTPNPPAAAAQKSQQDKPSKAYRFGIYTTDAASTVTREISPLLTSLEAQLGVEVVPYIFPEYEEGIKGIATGDVDFMRLGPASYVMVREQNPEIHLLAMESKKGKRTFSGVIAVHEDARFENLTELKGKRFAFGDPLSTVGRYCSQNVLINAGVHGVDLAAYDFLDRHDKVGMAVAAKEYDAGALKNSTFKSLVEQGEPIRALQTFDVVTKPWVARSDLDPKRLEALRQALFSLELESLKAVAKDGFLSAEDAYYQPIRDAIAASAAF